MAKPVKVHHDLDSFSKAVYPGIYSIVMTSFENKLVEKMQNLVDEVYTECLKELPIDIELQMDNALGLTGERNFNVTIDLRTSNEKNNSN